LTPIDYERDPKTGMILTRGHGALVDEDVFGHARRIASERAATPDADELMDLSDASVDAVTSAVVARAAHIARAAPRGAGPARLAIVAPTDASYGLARMYELLNDAAVLQVRVFRSLAEARGWLGIA